jgi:hypothetical protein
MVEIFYDYIPDRFFNGLVRSLGIGTPLYLSPEMDLFMDYGGTMFWVVPLRRPHRGLRFLTGQGTAFRPPKAQLKVGFPVTC